MACRHRFSRGFALVVLPLAGAGAGAATIAAPTVQQARATMDHQFDQDMAELPASDTSRMIAEALRPRLQALSSCVAPADTGGIDTFDCIASAEAGHKTVHLLLRFIHVDGQWTLAPQPRHLPAPVPPIARVQTLLREQLSARLARSDTPQKRVDLASAARTIEVLGVHNCKVGEAAPVIECLVGTVTGNAHSHQTMAFTWVAGQWQNADTP